MYIACNDNHTNMRRLFSVLLVFGLIAMSSCQKADSFVSKLYGSWRLVKVTDENDYIDDFNDLVLTFSRGDYDSDAIGVIGIGIWGESGQDMGTYFYDSNTKQLTIDAFEFYGVFEVKKLTSKQLVLYIPEDKATATFTKL